MQSYSFLLNIMQIISLQKVFHIKIAWNMKRGV